MATISHPTRMQYLTICGGCPTIRKGKRDNLNKRELDELDAVIPAVQRWVKGRGIDQLVWQLLPATREGMVVCSLVDDEKYESLDMFVVQATQRIWKSIGTPVIDEAGGAWAFHVEDGTWPYTTEDPDGANPNLLQVGDRVIDIAHVGSLIEDELADFLSWWWSRPSFEVVKMVRDLILHVDLHGFDDKVTEKLAYMRTVVFPWAGHLPNGRYPYDQPDGRGEDSQGSHGHTEGENNDA